MEGLAGFVQQQVLHIDKADDVVGGVLIYGKTGKHVNTIDLDQFLVGGVHIGKDHVDTGNHNVLCQGITEIHHVIYHFQLFFFDDAFLMAYIHDGTQLVLGDDLLFLVGINAKKPKEASGKSIYDKNHRGKQKHQKIDDRGYQKGQLFRIHRRRRLG